MVLKLLVLVSSSIRGDVDEEHQQKLRGELKYAKDETLNPPIQPHLEENVASESYIPLCFTFDAGTFPHTYSTL